jgi:hypothetical protein
MCGTHRADVAPTSEAERNFALSFLGEFSTARLSLTGVDRGLRLGDSFEDKVFADHDYIPPSGTSRKADAELLWLPLRVKGVDSVPGFASDSCWSDDVVLLT